MERIFLAIIATIIATSVSASELLDKYPKPMVSEAQAWPTEFKYPMYPTPEMVKHPAWPVNG